jgi:hypothetical protein
MLVEGMKCEMSDGQTQPYVAFFVLTLSLPAALASWQGLLRTAVALLRWPKYHLHACQMPSVSWPFRYNITILCSLGE